jgi:hypothetical protein
MMRAGLSVSGMLLSERTLRLQPGWLRCGETGLPIAMMFTAYLYEFGMVLRKRSIAQNQTIA